MRPLLTLPLALAFLFPLTGRSAPSAGILAIEAGTLHTVAGQPIPHGVVLIAAGKITAVGPRNDLVIPEGARRLAAPVVTPGLIDARTTLGLSGMLNQPHDQEQRDRSAPLQPELRALDAYNPADPLVAYVRSFGVTTLHTGHGPGSLISGQTMVLKTVTQNPENAILKPMAMIAATLGQGAVTGSDKPPGTRARAMAMLRAELIRALEYHRKATNADPDKRPARDLRLETLGRALDGTQPLLVTVQREADIRAALRLAAEFNLRIVLDGAAEAFLAIPDLRASGFPVLLHPTMQRNQGELENLSFTTAARLREAGIPFALQSGYEAYVPKTRVVLLEAALAAAHGLGPDAALAAITLDAAKILGVDDRVGSLAPGKDADLALFDGDPFEYTTRCVGVVLDGEVVSQQPR